MKNVLRYLFAVNGRSARPGMILATALFLGFGYLSNTLGLMVPVLGFPILLISIVLVWTGLIAVPIRRFHDMGRSWWWVALLLGGGIAGFGFFVADLSVGASIVGLTPWAAFWDAESYVTAVDVINADLAEGLEPMQPIGAVGWGGVSLAMIFLLIQFGWLHLIPGDSGENRFGASPSSPSSVSE